MQQTAAIRIELAARMSSSDIVSAIGRAGYHTPWTHAG
jgi:hypothetical protein